MSERTPALREAAALEAAGAVVDETSLRFTDPASLNWEKLAKLCGFLGSVGRAYPWWVGDVLNMSEDVLGEEFAQLETYFPHSPQTLANYKSVAKHVPRSRRRGLHMTVVAEVAYLPPRERDRLIDEAVKGGWKREEMREARRALASPQDEDTTVLPPPPTKVCPHCGCVLEE